MYSSPSGAAPGSIIEKSVVDTCQEKYPLCGPSLFLRYFFAKFHSFWNSLSWPVRAAMNMP